MSHHLPTRRRLRVAAPVVAALLSATLVGCGDDDGAGTATPAPASAAEPVSPSVAASSGSASSGSASSGSSADAALPAWAPKILTDADADDAVTGLDFTGTPAPTGELQFAVVRTGDGPAVETGQTITANYFGQLPDADEPFDESYSSQPFQAAIGVGQLISGWDQTLPGVPVGSRVVMSVPPALGYGDKAQGPIPAGSTLFFVIDILDAQ